jgi:hypothetical protein
VILKILNRIKGKVYRFFTVVLKGEIRGELLIMGKNLSRLSKFRLFGKEEYIADTHFMLHFIYGCNTHR